MPICSLSPNELKTLKDFGYSNNISRGYISKTHTLFYETYMLCELKLRTLFCNIMQGEQYSFFPGTIFIRHSLDFVDEKIKKPFNRGTPIL